MMVENTHPASLAGFTDYVSGLRSGLKREYDRSVNRDLARQQWQALFQRNVTTVLKQAYQAALLEVEKLSPVAAGERKEGLAGLRAQVLQPFEGLVEELMVYALQKHRSSCALSNFPDEHNPHGDYLAAVIEETSRDWSAFAGQVQSLLSRDRP
jgi:hypothetical protein